MDNILVSVLLLNIVRRDVSCHVQQRQQRCVYIDYTGKDGEEIPCSGNKICQQAFNITYVTMYPYAYENKTHNTTVEKLILQCCGNCRRLNQIKYLQNITEVSPSTISSSDFVYPFLASHSAETLYGYHFIPTVDVPYTLYITKEKSRGIILSILHLYPLVVICVMMAIVAGFFVWILETWSNEDLFPRPFLIGWFDGIWWSWISMTTVGYGDKVPKTFGARLLSIVWILIGITAFGLLTGSVTTSIMDVNTPPPADMKGMRVGVLQYRYYDAYLVAKHGGKVVESKGREFYSDFFSLIDLLVKDEINGMLLDKYTLWFVTHVLTEQKVHQEKKEQVDFFINQTIRTEKRYDERLCYGMLVRDPDDYEYFRHVTNDNRFHLERVWTMLWLKAKDNFTKRGSGKFYSVGNHLFNPNEGYFQYSAIALSAVIIAICIFGIVYERKRNNRQEFQLCDINVIPLE